MPDRPSPAANWDKQGERGDEQKSGRESGTQGKIRNPFRCAGNRRTQHRSANKGFACWRVTNRGLLTLFITYLGEGKPLALLSVPVRHLRSLTGTACDRFSVAASSGRPAFSQRGEKRHSRRPSPQALISSQCAFTRQASGHEASPPKKQAEHG